MSPVFITCLDRHALEADGLNEQINSLGSNNSNWGHNLGYMSEDIWNFISTVQEEKHAPFKTLWVLMDLAVIAMFGPIGNNYDEQSLTEA
jgi:hypothetical protein